MRFTTLALAIFFCIEANFAWSATVTFQDSFQYPTPKPGWSYLWNSGGPVGDPANYTALLPNPFGGYTSNGANTPTPSPASFVNFRITDGIAGGHPGEGANQSTSGGIERYAIAAYSILEPATVSIANGWLRNSNPNANGSTDGLNLKVFVNDETSPRISMTTAPGTGSIVEFGAPLGDLASGSTIYVAVGSVNEDPFDGFQLRYDLVGVPEPIVPEPNTFVLVGIAIAFAGVSLAGRQNRSRPN